MSAESVRQYIVDFLRREIVGPDPGFPAVQLNREEILRPQDPPRLRYGAGVLFPVRASLALQDTADEQEIAGSSADSPGDDRVLDGDVDESFARGLRNVGGEQPTDADYEVNRANDYLPSAMGLSTLLAMPRRLRIRVTAGRYEKLELLGQGRVDRSGKYHPANGWARIPIQGELIFDCSRLIGRTYAVAERPVPENGRETDLHVHLLVRPPRSSEGGEGRIVTVTLINRKIARNPRPADDECFFQCGFEVDDPDGSLCFCDYPERAGGPQDDEEASHRLLYRHQRVYAVGHGCAADWAPAVDDRCAKVWSENLPTFETNPILPREIPGLSLSMRLLADDTAPAQLELCRRLATEYSAWISSQEESIEREGVLQADLRETARRHMRRCRDCLRRINEGIDLLESDPTSRRAFALMNRAMLMQQLHYALSTQPREWKVENRQLILETPFQAPSYEDDSKQWRPFQLAFILMCLRSVVEPESDDRKIVDVIWFPTGGGKTEAYLGLSAFSLLLRRLTDHGNAGTTVLMRYTLRLLTTQQYQRAASLICACEKLRREQPDELGGIPITIGLWVGGEVTPNNQAEAVRALERLLNGQEQNRFVVLSCPWCGAQMGPVNAGGRIQCKGYQRLARPARVALRCDDHDCEFSDRNGLLLKVIDSDIYEEPPSLVIGTVDKFAMLPWRPARSIFGLESGGRYRPPDLVIQDELHLISGPLGSMVGHYETVIEALCSSQSGAATVPPKIVASTATIARASQQVRALYGRRENQVFLFPPQGLKAGDSFFAEERADQPGRLYLGVLATALPSHVTAQIRVMSALLQAVKLAPAADTRFIDPYWTMMGYFNSLRELGHASTMIRADIREYLNAMWDRMGLTGTIGGEEGRAKRRFINKDIELTSRIQSGRITEVLQQLFTTYDGTRHSDAVDVCFATNMIQVGLDVPRLSLMTIVGQPKLTSEYIQASSRVGRASPGLVVTNYSPGKPRDRSHFEHFRAYHESIYRYVEPTSVTPFAVPVRERALHALIVTLARFWGDDRLRARPDVPPDVALAARIRSTILERVEGADPTESAETDTMIGEILSDWSAFRPPKYGDFSPPTEETPLMFPAGGQQHPLWNDRPFATPTSMRNVDATCDARVLAVYPRPN